MSEEPWTPFYGDIPASISYPDVTMYETLERSLSEYGDLVALDFLGTKITYRRLHRDVLAVARALWALGVRPGDRLALVLPNVPHVAVLVYAAVRIGVVVTLLHAEANVVALQATIAAFRPQWCATTREHVDGLYRLITPTGVGGVIVCEYGDYARNRQVRDLVRLRQRFNVDLGGIRGAAVQPNDGPDVRSEVPPMFSWSSLFELGRDLEIPAHRSCHEPGAPAIVLWTSGSGGEQRGVVHGDRQFTAVALQAQVQGPLLAGQTLAGLIPLSGGLGIGMALHAVVAAGASLLLVPHFTARSLARLLRRRQPEYLVATPGTYGALVMERSFRKSRHRSLMGAFCGGDRLPRSVRDRFELLVRRRGGAVRIREGYGSMETVAACATMPDIEDRPGSVGIPYPDTLIRIARPASMLDRRHRPPAWVAAESLGEILVSGPTVMDGYLDDDEATLRALQKDDEGRVWLRTGDLGRMDSDGFLYFVERMGRAVSAATGEIHPGITELFLSEHGEVLESCVTVVQSNGSTELTAHVAPVDRDRDRGWLENHLRESLQLLDRAQQPASYSFHDRLPRTLAGYVDHRRLAAERGRR